MILPPSVCHSLKFVRSFGKVNDTEDKNIDLNNTVTIWIFRRKIRNIRDQVFLTHENYENKNLISDIYHFFDFQLDFTVVFVEWQSWKFRKQFTHRSIHRNSCMGKKIQEPPAVKWVLIEACYVGWPRRRVTPFYLPMSPKKQSKIRPTSVGVEMSLSPSCLYFFRPWT